MAETASRHEVSEEVAEICDMALQTRSSRVVPRVWEGLGGLGGPHILLLTLPIPREISDRALPLPERPWQPLHTHTYPHDAWRQRSLSNWTLDFYFQYGTSVSMFQIDREEQWDDDWRCYIHFMPVMGSAYKAEHDAE